MLYYLGNVGNMVYLTFGDRKYARRTLGQNVTNEIARVINFKNRVFSLQSPEILLVNSRLDIFYLPPLNCSFLGIGQCCECFFYYVALFSRAFYLLPYDYRYV